LKYRKRNHRSITKGQVLEGVVKNITSYGVFIDLGGVDGLIHITDFLGLELTTHLKFLN
jgi:ribosomal protein S1